MRKTGFWIPAGLCLAFIAVLAIAQGTRRPGLWESTTSMTFQQSPFPPNIQMPPNSPFGGGSHVTQVCVTQEMIDRYGGPAPQSRGDCQMSNMVKRDNGMTADWVCTGQMAGRGNLETTWTEDGHSHTKIHFTGTMQMGPRSTPVEWTMDSTSTYKGADCGSVKPLQMPAR